MPSYKLHYFDARGYGEMIRLVFAEAGVEYEDVRYSREEWPKHKPDMLFGQMPVLFVDGEQIAHSRAALRYVGREFKLDGGSSINAAKGDMWLEVLVETLTKLPFLEQDEKKKEEQMAIVFKENIIPLFTKLENAIQGNYLFGDNPSASDFGIYSILDFMRRSVKGDHLANFPKINNMMKCVESRPKIAKWLKERPETAN